MYITVGVLIYIYIYIYIYIHTHIHIHIHNACIYIHAYLYYIHKDWWRLGGGHGEALLSGAHLRRGITPEVRV